MDEKESAKEEELFLEYNELGADVVAEGVRYIDEEDEDGSPALHSSGSFSSYQWPRSYRETADSYAITASPSFGSILGGTRNISYSGFESNIQSSLDSRAGTPLLFGLEKVQSKQDLDKHIKSQSSICSGKASFHEQPTREPPVTHGCSFVQTLFNDRSDCLGRSWAPVYALYSERSWVGKHGSAGVFALVCYYTAILIIYCLESEEGIMTFADMGEAAFGRYGRLVISIILFLELYLCATEVITLERYNLARLFPGSSVNFSWLQLDTVHLYGIVATIIFLPTVWLKDLRLLSYVSAGGVIATIVIVFSLFFLGTAEGIGFHHSAPLVNWSGVPFCSRHLRVLLFGFFFCVLLYGGAAIMGYLMFGEGTMSQITLNMPANAFTSKVALWTTVINPLGKYALMINPLARSLEELLPANLSGSLWCFILLRTALVISSACVAFFVPFFDLVMALVGSACSVILAVIMPALCYLKILGKKATKIQIVLSGAVVAVGIVSGVSGIYYSLTQIASRF